VKREVVIVLGKTGQGKSVWTKHYSKQFNRLFVYDLAREYPVTYYMREQILDMLEAEENDIHVAGHSIPTDPNRRNDGGLGDTFRIGIWKRDDVEFLQSLAFVRGSCTIILEEMSTIYGRGERMDASLSEIVFLGRHRRVSVVATAQRASSIPVDLRSQANRVVSFAQAEQRDMSWLEDYFGDRTYEIPELETLECLDFHNGQVSRYSIASYIKGAKNAAPESTEGNDK
jgi:hypothetical protein